MNAFRAPGTLSPVLSNNWDTERPWTLDGYRATGGYQALARAWEINQEKGALTNLIKESGLRGRGGAGFPTGLKWSFLPPEDGGARYLVVNADESEPGTCKDIPFLMANPHLLIEGMAICLMAIGGHDGFIYLRGEVVHVYRRLLAAVREAKEAGIIGKGLGPNGDYDINITVHAGAGAYICGEETALLDSLEGFRGQPRLKPPFPAVAGLYARPTVVNNVESIASVPGIIKNGTEWFTAMGAGTKNSPGHGIFSISGHVKNPGQFEAPFGITMRELLDMAGGIREGHELKFFAVGGSSAPLFTPDHLDVPLGYEEVAEAGSMLATRAIQIFDETVSVVRVVSRWTDFYQHESCGKCTPCREGTFWMRQIMHRFEAGQGTEADIDLLYEIASNIAGRSFCALGDAAATPIRSAIDLFRSEFVDACSMPTAEQYPIAQSALFSEVGVR
ncbi:NADH-quinone oxidoreductase subunit NuoF [Arcanobacterium phocisimile]|uniref:NADH-quinone oxidoreductase subunit F n=1 Tax=Arcanobacterium phocisimile TaxID=1302235 RepID=A0ABX7IH50_9ACTO|nr:NADH-quinone oxidoreductase subunit NuoF [Arcanobacterium phocisimile]QRV02456.1 NADH-quinone oxidoreductase subunit NuoF [Arcanobacterium phocisimile]